MGPRSSLRHFEALEMYGEVRLHSGSIAVTFMELFWCQKSSLRFLRPLKYTVKFGCPCSGNIAVTFMELFLVSEEQPVPL